MRAALILFLTCMLALPLVAQTSTQRGSGAVLRLLDKVSGQVQDFTLSNGGGAQFERLTVTLGDCRFPPGNRQGEAYAWIDVREDGEPVFAGWMIASSPALSAMDHPRYDVWVLRCSSS